ncbi:hypothetical protein MTO96_005114 [Rhipicephalus appendiculatus]
MPTEPPANDSCVGQRTRRQVQGAGQCVLHRLERQRIGECPQSDQQTTRASASAHVTKCKELDASANAHKAASRRLVRRPALTSPSAKSWEVHQLEHRPMPTEPPPVRRRVSGWTNVLLSVSLMSCVTSGGGYGVTERRQAGDHRQRKLEAFGSKDFADSTPGVFHAASLASLV